MADVAWFHWISPLNRSKQMLAKYANIVCGIALCQISFTYLFKEYWERERKTTLFRIVFFFSLFRQHSSTSKRPIAFLSVNKHDVKRQPFVGKSFWHAMSHSILILPHSDWWFPSRYFLFNSRSSFLHTSNKAAP